MSYEPTDLVRHAWRKPPRCVAAFVVEPLSAPESAWECWDELALLHLGCPCGSRQFRVLGFPHAEAGLLCPITLECPACGASALLFDIAEHGSAGYGPDVTAGGSLAGSRSPAAAGV